MKNEIKKRRQSNFELLRIVCILMVITLHYCNANMGGALNTKNIPDNHYNYYIVRCIESLSIVAVNCFILITGYFMNDSRKIKIKKILNLIFILIFYNIFMYILSIVFNIQKFNNESMQLFLKTFHEGGCWFIIIYIVLYTLTPFINIIIKNINKKQFLFLIAINIIFFSIYPTFLSNTTVKDNGYGIINFIMLYLIGAYIARYKKNDKKIAMYALLYIAMQSITLLDSIKDFTENSAFSYNNIFNIIGSISLFMVFSKLKFESNIVNYISKHTLGIYIYHVNAFINVAIWRMIFKTNQYYTSKYLILNCIGSVIVVFLVGLIIDSIREKLFNVTIEKALKNSKIYNYEFKIEDDENEKNKDISNEPVKEK